MILILFFTGVNSCKTPAYGIEGRVPTAIFHYRFIDLSLISRFPIYIGGRAVGSHANLNAVGQGAYGGQSPL